MRALRHLRRAWHRATHRAGFGGSLKWHYWFLNGAAYLTALAAYPGIALIVRYNLDHNELLATLTGLLAFGTLFCFHLWVAGWAMKARQRLEASQTCSTPAQTNVTRKLKGKIPLLLGAAALALFVVAFGAAHIRSEIAQVKYRGSLDLALFECNDVSRSSFINRVCYDRRNEYMLISLNGTYYHYCEIDSDTVSSLLSASSMGRFYNANIRGRFDCRNQSCAGVLTRSGMQ